jgi:hypothetical protein
VILIDEHAIFIEDRRPGAAVVVAQVAELLTPDDPAVEVERGEAVRAERRVDVIADA